MIPTTWLTLIQGLWLQSVCAVCMIYIVSATNNIYICDLKHSIRLTARHRWDKRDSMYLGDENGIQ